MAKAIGVIMGSRIWALTFNTYVKYEMFTNVLLIPNPLCEFQTVRSMHFHCTLSTARQLAMQQLSHALGEKKVDYVIMENPDTPPNREF